MRIGTLRHSKSLITTKENKIGKEGSHYQLGRLHIYAASLTFLLSKGMHYDLKMLI